MPADATTPGSPSTSGVRTAWQRGAIEQSFHAYLGVTEDPAREVVDHDGEVEPALAGRDGRLSELGHAVAAGRDAAGLELGVDPAWAVGLAALAVDGRDTDGEPSVLHCMAPATVTAPRALRLLK